MPQTRYARSGDVQIAYQVLGDGPIDLIWVAGYVTHLDVYWEGHPAGQAIPFILGRHVHRQVPQALPPAPPAPTGVDYLGLVLAAHDAETLGQLAFRDLPVLQPQNGQTDGSFEDDHQP